MNDIATQAERAAELGRAQARQEVSPEALKRLVGGTVRKNPGHMQPSPDAGANALMTDVAASGGKPLLGDPIPERTTGIAPEAEVSMSALDRAAHEDQASVEPALLAEIDELLAIDMEMETENSPASNEKVLKTMATLRRMFAAVGRIREARTPKASTMISRRHRQLQDLIKLADALAEVPSPNGTKVRTVHVPLEIRVSGTKQNADPEVGIKAPWFEYECVTLGKRMQTQILTNALHDMHDRGYTFDRVADVLRILTAAMYRLDDALSDSEGRVLQEAVMDDLLPADRDDRDQT